MEITPMNPEKPNLLKSNTLNLIRTISRNNVERLGIADQKASVLLSINAIMITILLPMVFQHSDFIVDQHLYVPLIIFCLSCIVTLFFTASALMPVKMSFSKSIYEKNFNASPFYFGNFFKMTEQEYAEYFKEAMKDEDLIGDYILQDLFHIGKIVAAKYVIIRKAYVVFILGLLISIISTIFLFTS
jgi:hypothetical protein